MDSPCLREKDPLSAWKQLEREFPALALMARDVLAVPISGVGVERTFNMARDVCGYRRGQLSHESFRQQMLIKYHDRHHMRPEVNDDDEDQLDALSTMPDPAEQLSDPDLVPDRIEDDDIYDVEDRDGEDSGFIVDEAGHALGPGPKGYCVVDREYVEVNDEEEDGNVLTDVE